MANEQPAQQDQPQPAAQDKRFDEFDGQPVYLVNGQQVDPNGQPVKGKK